jgi:hypothetical protein
MKPRNVRSTAAPPLGSAPDAHRASPRRAQPRLAAAPTRLESSLQYGPPIAAAEDCSRLLVYNMQPLARFGFGSQLANYLLAFAAAQQLNRSLVVVGKYTLGCDEAEVGTLTACVLQATTTCEAPTPPLLDLARCYNRKRPRGAVGQHACDAVQRREDGATVLRCDVDDALLRVEDSACNPAGDAVRSVNVLVAHANWARAFSYAHWAAYEETLLRGTSPGGATRIGGAMCARFSASSPPPCDARGLAAAEVAARTAPAWPGWSAGAPVTLVQDSEGGDCHRCGRLRLFRVAARIALRWHPRFAARVRLERAKWAISPPLPRAQVATKLRAPYAGVHIRMGDAQATGRLVVTIDSAIAALASVSDGGRASSVRDLVIATDDVAAVRAQCAAESVASRGFKCSFLAPSAIARGFASRGEADEGVGGRVSGAVAGARGAAGGHFQEAFNAKPSAARFETYARLMLELEMLVEADYFVATFESNLDSIVNVLRTQPATSAVAVGDAHWIPAI